MHWGVTPLEILIGSGYVTVTGLVPGNYNAFGISQIPQPAILEAVELVTVIPPKSLSN